MTEPRPPYYPRIHAVVNVNRRHQDEGGINQWIALALTKGVGTMWAAYIFGLLALLGFPGLDASAQAYIQWLSQTFIEVGVLSVLAVGQQLLSRQAELQAEESYHTTVKIFHDVELLMSQGNEQIRLLDRLVQQQEAILQLLRSDAQIPFQMLTDIYASLQTCATVSDVRDVLRRIASREEMRTNDEGESA